MADTIRTLTALQTIFADNAPNREITAQDVRDVLISVAGNLFLKEVSVSTALIQDDIFVAVDCTSGPKTVTLPTLSKHKLFFIKKADNSANNLTIQPSGGTLIDGDANAVLGAPFGVLNVMGGASTWHLF